VDAISSRNDRTTSLADIRKMRVDVM
jgi:hypothetical protein